MHHNLGFMLKTYISRLVLTNKCRLQHVMRAQKLISNDFLQILLVYIFITLFDFLNTLKSLEIRLILFNYIILVSLSLALVFADSNKLGT